jgi:hypothetical protein
VSVNESLNQASFSTLKLSLSEHAVNLNLKNKFPIFEKRGANKQHGKVQVDKGIQSLISHH